MGALRHGGGGTESEASEEIGHDEKIWDAETVKCALAIAPISRYGKGMNLKRSLSLLAIAMVFAVGLAHSQDAEKKPKGPERWESTIEKFEEGDKASPPPKNALLFVGSSSIRMWELEKNFPKRKTVNRGFGGSTIPDSNHYFDRLITPHQPKAILLYAGDNDVARELTDEDKKVDTSAEAQAEAAKKVAADFETFAALVNEKLPGTPVIYIAIKPSTKRWNMWPAMKDANDRIAAWCEKNDGFYFADIGAPMLADVEAGKPPADWWFKSDGLHLTQEGYDGWAKVIKPLLKEALAPKGN